MKFQVRPILSEMKKFYLKPISPERFKEYILKLQGGSKGDLKLPISGYNPMAKEHMYQKIEELEALQAEAIMDRTIREFNKKLNKKSETKIEVVLNLADDLKGGWTNFYSTDFDSKFNFNAIASRKFCTPFFWTSEKFSKMLIQRRTKEYLNRTVYWLNNSKPKTLEEHVNQEIFVCMNALEEDSKDTTLQFDTIEAYYDKNKKSEEYDLIFNFLYGDEASENLGYKKFGIKHKSGFEYAKFIAKKRKTNT